MLNSMMKIISILILIISVIVGIMKLINIIENSESNNYNNSKLENSNKVNIAEKINDNEIEDGKNNNINKKVNHRINNNKYYYDLIIVGAGLSGLTAAYEANKLSNNSLKILLLETSSKYGGNSVNEIDGINILMPSKKYKNKKKKEDSFSSFFDDSFEFGRYSNDKDLLTLLVNNSYELYDFLFKELNCDSLKLVQSEGSKIPRTLIYDSPDKTTGKYLSDIIYNKLNNISSVDIFFNSHFIDFVINENHSEIKGVIYEIQENYYIFNVTAYSKAVILATGGFGSDFYTDESILKEYLAQYYYLPTISTRYTQGIGLKIGRNKGASLIYLREAEVYPTCFVDLFDRYNRHKTIAPDLLRELGGILLNKRGKRFCDEIGDRRYVAQSILKNCDIVTDPKIIKQYEGFLIINDEIKEKYGEKIDDYISSGFFKKYKSFDEFSHDMNISEYYVNIRKSIISYNQGCESKRDKYGKKVFPTKFKMGDNIYVAIITPCIFHTLGGLRISENAEVLNEAKKPIKGLFAAGQVIGGVHGMISMQGNILTQSTVFGKLAANSAVNYIKK